MLFDPQVRRGRRDRRPASRDGPARRSAGEGAVFRCLPPPLPRPFCCPVAALWLRCGCAVAALWLPFHCPGAVAQAGTGEFDSQDEERLRELLEAELAAAVTAATAAAVTRVATAAAAAAAAVAAAAAEQEEEVAEAAGVTAARIADAKEARRKLSLARARIEAAAAELGAVPRPPFARLALADFIGKAVSKPRRQWEVAHGKAVS